MLESMALEKSNLFWKALVLKAKMTQFIFVNYFNLFL